MAPVTIADGDNSSYYQSGTVGWTARSAFSFHSVVEVISNAASLINIGNTTSAAAAGQSFVTPATAGRISGIRVPIQNFGAPTDELYVTLRTNDVNRPSATILGTSETASATRMSTTTAWREFKFASSIEVTANTKYWFTLERSGAVNASNYYRVGYSSSNLYPGGGNSTLTAGTWTTEGASNDLNFQLLYEAPQALYHVTQDSSLHMWRSTDYGTTWSEMDGANAPSVYGAIYPFDATDTVTGPFIATARMTGATNVGVRLFNMRTNTWDSSDYGTTPPSSVNSARGFRITVNNVPSTATDTGAVYLMYTDQADTADIAYQRVTARAAAWGAKVAFFGGTTAESSMVLDVFGDRAGAGNIHGFYYNAVADDVEHRSILVTTSSTTVDVDDTAASDDTRYAAGVIQTHIDATTGVTAATIPYINSNDQIYGRYMRFDTTSASAYMSGGFVISTDTGATGRSLSSARYESTDYVVFSKSSSAISYTTSTSTGTWDTDVAWKTGLTSATLTQALSIPTIGLIVFYTENGIAKADWLVGPTIPPTLVGLSESPTLGTTEGLSTATTVDTQADADTITVTDAATIAATVTRTDSDTFTVSESLSALSTIAVNLADTATITRVEDFASAGTLPLADTDTFTVSETFVPAATMPLADSDTFTVTESLATVTITDVALSDSDTITGTETLAQASTLPLSDTPTLSITENLATVTGKTLAIVDSDTITGTETAAIAATVSLTDSPTLAVVEQINVEDLITSVDLALSDTTTISGTETLQSAGSFTTTDSDTITGSEAYVAIRAQASIDSGTISSAESLAVNTITNVGLSDSDTFTAAETLAPAGTIPLTDTDTFTVAESLGVNTITNVALTDTTPLIGTENTQISASLTITDTDTITASESLAVATTATVTLSDSDTLTGTETLVPVSTVALTDTDTITGVEVWQTVAATLSLSDSDTFTINELLTSGAISDVALNDSGSLTSVETFSQVSGVAISDTIALAATEALSGHVTQTNTDVGLFMGIETAFDAVSTMTLTDTDTFTESAGFGTTGTVSLNDTPSLGVLESLVAASTLSISDTDELYVTDVLFISEETETTDFTDSVVVGVLESFTIVTTATLVDVGILTGNESYLSTSAYVWIDNSTLTVVEQLNSAAGAIYDRIAGMARTSPTPTTPFLSRDPHEINLFLAEQNHEHGMTLTRVSTLTPFVLTSATTDNPLTLTSSETLPMLGFARETEDII